MAREAHAAGNRYSPSHVHQDGGHILTLNVSLNAVGLTVQVIRLAEEKTCYVQEVRPHIFQDILLQVSQTRFGIKHGMAGHQENLSPEGNSNFARVKYRLQGSDRI